MRGGRRRAKYAGAPTTATLVGPIEALIKDKRQLLVVPSGALTAVPFQLLVTEKPGASREAIAAHAREIGLPELFLPRLVMAVEHLPLLGTGKADYRAVSKLASEAAAPAAERAGAREAQRS